jgi:hypothetical protein
VQTFKSDEKTTDWSLKPNFDPGVQAKGHHHHQHHFEAIKVQQDVGVCEKDCGIESAKCMIQTFNPIKCAQDEAACALDCLKGIQV